MMAKCVDFRDEESCLEYIARLLGVTVDFTPKFHAELAGEGIEYLWAYSKGYYRRCPMKEKKGRESFKKLVRKCTDPKEALTRDRAIKFSGRSRSYICTYYWLELQERKRSEQEAAATGGNQDEEALALAPRQMLHFAAIERMKKKFRTHRCALDFDAGFVNAFLREQEANTSSDGRDGNDGVSNEASQV